MTSRAQITNTKLEKTLRQILNPNNGKFLIITSTSVEDALHKIYDRPPLGPLRKTMIDVEHRQLANDFACWGSWEEAKDLGRDGEQDTSAT